MWSWKQLAAGAPDSCIAAGHGEREDTVLLHMVLVTPDSVQGVCWYLESVQEAVEKSVVDRDTVGNGAGGHEDDEG